jgi:hypothetical protein
MGSVASAEANSIVTAWSKGTSYAGNAAVWVKLHIGAPGSAGTTNAAANTTRQQATFGTASAGVIATTADISWVSVPNAETYSHVSFWTLSSAGTFLGWDDLSATATVAIGDTFRIPSGSLTVTVTPAA